MRHRTFHLWMNRLALAAVLALLLVPTTGRMAGMAPMQPEAIASAAATLAGRTASAAHAMAGPVPASAAAPIAATDSLATAHPASPHSPRPGPNPNPGPHDGMPADCAYCPLLQTMAALPSWIALAAPAIGQEARIAPALPPRRGQRHPTGLGSRGPPRAA